MARGVIKSRNKWIKKDGYWIGIDCNGREFKFSCNNEEIEKEILENTWCVCAGYVKCGSLDIRMHTFIKKTPKGKVVDHINNDGTDNREENLRVVTVSENSRNRKKTRNNGSKYVGMRCTSSGKFRSEFWINGHLIGMPSKIEEEAEIDNLIVQKYYNMRHNEEDFYRLENVSEERILEVVNLVEKKLKKKEKELGRIPTNSYEYEDLGTSIKVYFCEGKYYFLMDKNDVDKFGYLEGGKFFVHGNFGKNNGGYVMYHKKREKYQVHRYILNLKDDDFVVDHKNHDRVDNKKCNLEIVTRLSNSQNKESKGYRFLEDRGKFKVYVGRQYKYFDLFIGGGMHPRFSTEEEAIQEVARRKEIIDATRVRLKSLEELESLKRYAEENGFDNYDDAYLYWANVKERVDKINLKYLYTFNNNCI